MAVSPAQDCQARSGNHATQKFKFGAYSLTLLNVMNEMQSFWEDAVLVERDDILEYNEANIIAQDNVTISNIRSWLRPTDFDSEGSEYQKHLSSHLRGTGAWVTESPIYQQWHESSEHGLLWIRGIPGSGKSVLAAKLVCELSQEQAPVLYFFFRQIVDVNHNPRAALQDWLAQILPYSPPLQFELKGYLEPSDLEAQSSQPRELDSVSMSDLWQHLRAALSHMPKAYLVVDALDEMDQTPDAEMFLQHLSSFACWQPSHIKVIMTSRPVASMERLLLRVALLRLSLDDEHVDQDIGAYVMSRLENSNISSEHYTPIQAAVPGRAKGLFLYAKLAMDSLLKERINIRHALSAIPENLDRMYAQLLDQHAVRSGVSMEVQQLIMQWITHSVRPLRLIELADILARYHVPSDGNLGAAKQVLRSACGSLLELLPDETICVVHHSLTEFLTGETRIGLEDYAILEFQPTHHRLAQMCLMYLQNGCLENAEPQPPSRQGLCVQPHAEPLLAPFTRYAALNWSTHVIRCGNFGADRMNIVLDSFTAHTNFQKWAYVAGLRKAGKATITPLFMAISLGLSEYLRHLLVQPNVDIDDGAPIVWAAAKGFADVVELLVNCGANLDQYDAEGYTALHRASMNNYPAVAATLLQAGCNINLATTIVHFDRGSRRSQHRAAWFACNYGHAEVLAELQKCMKTSKQVNYALVTAVKQKRTELVRQLLQHPLVQLNPDVPDLQVGGSKFVTFEESQTHRDRQNAPLVLACDNRDPNTIELLLAAGASANKGALHALARSKAAVDADTTERCFSSIIRAGADLNALDGEFRKNTPLQQATDATAARLLLEAGADVEADDGDSESALFTCRDADVLKVLVEIGGANLERRKMDGRTPLLASMSELMHKDTLAITTLIDLGADVNAVDKEGNGVFHHAIKGLYGKFPEGLIERLCAAGADINRPNNRGETPILLTKVEIRKAIDIGNVHIPRETTRFDILVAAGARLTPNAANVNRNSLFNWISKSLSTAREGQFLDVTEVLNQCGASLDIIDDEGRSLLHDVIKIWHGGKAQLNFLLDQGLDPLATDCNGNTLWHEAASHRAQAAYRQAPMELFERLYQVGLDPMQPNHFGRTPLHILSSLWPKRIHSLKDTSRPGIGLGHTNNTTAFDYTLSLSSEVDIPDEDGVTPLHLASTFCEYIVGRLLARGANPSRITKEGCNAFHLAARAKMPNIVQMLLSALQNESFSRFQSAVTARDHLGRTPLYYAYLAGSYECAQSLISAGATFDTDNYQTSAWRAIARFELAPTNSSSSSRDSVAGAVQIAHDSDPANQRSGYFSKNRMDELLALLAANTIGTSSMLDQAILDAAAFEADYTVERLLQTRKTVHFGEYVSTDAQLIASIDRRRIKREDLGKPCKNCQKPHCESPRQVAWSMDDYRSLPEALLAESNSDALKFFVQRLVSDGEAAVIKQIVVIGGPQALNDRIWDVKSNTKVSGTSRSQEEKEPLLLSACRRAAPNMDMIRVLVEQAKHNINAQQQISEKQDSSYQNFSDGRRYVEGESTLHALVRGEHWWHVNEALRYFLERGADTELRDITGMTPLSAVLNRCGGLIFNKTAVELLIQHGADVNAVDRAGQSCLAKACSDPEMVKLLLGHGAVVTRDVLIQAIELKDVELLLLLLSHGGDPNVHAETERPGWTRIRPADRYPLHHAIAAMTRSRQQESSEVDKHEEIVQTLLSHGANPCAAYGSTTILHELVHDNEDLTSLFVSTSITLNLNVLNAAGETPLHLACHKNGSHQRKSHQQSTANLLITHGANLHARDSGGNTIWHIFARTGGYGHKDTELQSFLALAPGLINIPNTAGETPLHIAMGNPMQTKMLDFLFNNGGDLHAVDSARNTLLHVLLRGSWTVCSCSRAKGWAKQPLTRMLAAGLDINARNHAGETPIFSFCRHGKVTQTLHCNGKNSGKNAESKAKMETTPSTQPAPFPDQPVYDQLTTAGVDWNAINAKGQNLLHVIASLGFVKDEERGKRPLRWDGASPAAKFRALMIMGLDAGREDAEGRTPVDVAADLGHQEILSMFQEV